MLGLGTRWPCMNFIVYIHATMYPIPEVSCMTAVYKFYCLHLWLPCTQSLKSHTWQLCMIAKLHSDRKARGYVICGMIGCRVRNPGSYAPGGHVPNHYVFPTFF